MFNTSGTTKVEVFKTAPQIMFSPEALAKMKIIIDESPDEVGWLSPVKKINNVYYIYDCYILEQEVHATTTEISPEGLVKLAEELMQAEGGDEILNNLSCWGHSHVRMSVSPSGQDEKQMEEFIGNRDYFIRVIANKKDEIGITLFDYVAGVKYENMPYTINYGLDLETMRSEIKAELTEKVTKKSYVRSTYKNNYKTYSGYSSYSKSSKEAIKDVKAKITDNMKSRIMNTSPSGIYTLLDDVQKATGVRLTYSQLGDLQDELLEEESNEFIYEDFLEDFYTAQHILELLTVTEIEEVMYKILVTGNREHIRKAIQEALGVSITDSQIKEIEQMALDLDDVLALRLTAAAEKEDRKKINDYLLKGVA